MPTERPNPHIRLSEAARQTLADALAREGGSWLRLKIDEGFAHELLFEPGAEGDIVVEVDGIRLLLDPASARRADGLCIDFVQDLHGAGLRFDNPNQPGCGEQTLLRRDCAATLIPYGEPLRLAQGEAVTLTQALGGSFTVRTASGQLARIAGEDADALGLEALQTEQPAAAGTFDLEQVVEVLRSVYDPEIPVNVVDLGLIYQCQAQPLADGGQRVNIKMSMTAPGCGMGDVLKEEARAKVQALPGVSQVEVELVWEPPWDQSRMSEAARLQLGLL
ncbi:putative Fe-S cluster assembly protein SufT [Pseudomonas sp. SA3-5]|uniref:Fe-S cluster assembly protein SufT n=1 Tax=Pseudomonas aestuarii TaxID=3018340 RepID=A0ABT4XED8_9PSED|nr:putative Fe-S cluster assembly protein SufT [Pseudomonas aestuarii]MDA7086579.1 putative Fe-S cluster assembly protein SufT [Pseudomonas aestuarii]